jgi:Tfp pilus assembly protein PilV
MTATSPIRNILENPSKLAAFSLIEVVLALGVVSFAIVGIMGLFPVAMRAGLESQRETRATHIARKIYSDLKASPATNALFEQSPGNYQTINLANSDSYPVFYNADGLPAGTNLTEACIFEVNLLVDANTPTNGLSRVQVDVVAPAQPTANRTTNTFVTLMRQD